MPKFWNCTPHRIVVFPEQNPDCKQVVWELPADSGTTNLRVLTEPQIELQARVVDMKQGKLEVIMPPLYSAPCYTGFSKEDEAFLRGVSERGETIVCSETSANAIAKLDWFTGTVLEPDTGPDAVVRNPHGDIMGTTRLILRQACIVLARGEPPAKKARQ